MHRFIGDIHILAYVYWCLWTIIIDENDITHGYRYFIFNILLCFLQEILVTLTKFHSIHNKLLRKLMWWINNCCLDAYIEIEENIVENAINKF